MSWKVKKKFTIPSYKLQIKTNFIAFEMLKLLVEGSLKKI